MGETLINISSVFVNQKFKTNKTYLCHVFLYTHTASATLARPANQIDNSLFLEDMQKDMPKEEKT